MIRLKRLHVLLIILVMLTTFFLPGCLERPGDDTRMMIKGSDTVLPLTQFAAEEFMLKNPDLTVSVAGGGSGVGIAALIDGEIQVAMSSREMRESEVEEAKNKGVNPVEHIVALDGIVVIVNPENEVSHLTLEELRGIYNGSISNWKDVGGEDRRISSITRDSSSGTYQYFRNEVLKNDNFRSDALSMSATGGVVQEVSQNRGSIGYIGFAYATDRVKTLALDTGNGPVAPTPATIEDREYPLARPLYYYSRDDVSGVTVQFIDFLLSDEGQDLVSEIGYFRVE